MEHYGTDDYYVDRLEKLGSLPAALRALAGGTFISALMMAKKKEEELKQEAEVLNEEFRREEAQRMSSTVQAYQHPGDRMMAGMSPLGMERLASVADKAGRSLAHSPLFKEAGLGSLAMGLGKSLKGLLPAAGGAARGGAAVATGAGKSVAKKPSLIGWKGKALLGGGALGAGYAGLKGLQTAKQYMMTPTSGGQRWGTGQQLRSGVNQWGQPVY